MSLSESSNKNSKPSESEPTSEPRAGEDGGHHDDGNNLDEAEVLRGQIRALKEHIAASEKAAQNERQKLQDAVRRRAVLDALREHGCDPKVLEQTLLIVENDLLEAKEDGEVKAMLNGDEVDLDDYLDHLRRERIPQLFTGGVRRAPSSPDSPPPDPFEVMRAELGAVR